jgi:hypothetical protein
MEYLSPIPILLEVGLDPSSFDPEKPGRLKKVLLLELDQRSDGLLTIDNRQYTKNDLLDFLDRLAQYNLKFDQWIYESPALLQLLQRQPLVARADILDEKYIKHPDFEEFKAYLKPFLTEVFVHAVNQAFIKKEFDKGAMLLKEIRLLSVMDRTLLEEKLKVRLTEYQEHIFILKKNPDAFDQKNFLYLDFNFVRFFNRLPKALEGHRTEVMGAMADMVISLDKKHVSFITHIMYIINSIRCDPQLKKIIRHNTRHFIYKEENSRTYENSKSEYIAYGLLLAILLFLFFKVTPFPGRDKAIKEPTDPESLIINAISTTWSLRKALKDMGVYQYEPMVIPDKSTGKIRESQGKAAIPFSFFYKSPQEPPKSHGLPVTVKNTSDYSAVVLHEYDDKGYAQLLQNSDTVTLYMAKNSRVWFYVGKNWDWNGTYVIQNLYNERKSYEGIFAKTDSLTLDYLNVIYQIAPDSVKGNLSLTLVSPRPDQLLIKTVPGIYSKQR